MIHTDENGKPYAVTPCREDYATDYDYIVAYHDYQRVVEAFRWKAMDEALQKEFRRNRRRAVKNKSTRAV